MSSDLSLLLRASWCPVGFGDAHLLLLYLDVPIMPSSQRRLGMGRHTIGRDFLNIDYLGRV